LIKQIVRSVILHYGNLRKWHEMPSKLIKLLQAAKTELEVRGLSNSNVYSAISSEIYYLEEEEGLPQDWREGI
jgi:hypothetical protein